LNKIGWMMGAVSKRRKKGKWFATSTAFPTTNAEKVTSMKLAKWIK
jgi:hypothetical protein